MYGNHRYLHVLTHSVPTRRSSDLAHRLLTGRARSRIRGLRYQHHQGKIFHAIVIAGKHAFRTHLLHAGRSPDLWRVRDLALLNRPPPSLDTGHLIEANSGPEAALASGPFSIDSRSEMQQRPGRFSVTVSARSTLICLAPPPCGRTCSASGAAGSTQTEEENVRD